MKKILSLIVSMILCIGVNAQTSLTEAVDFTTVDYNGNEIHLFEILEDGQYVLLHFNTRTNEETPTVTPPLVEAYNALGCNQHDVFFMCVSPNGTANTTQTWINDYGIEYPMIHAETPENFDSGLDIWQMYSCAFPTTVLIAPDKSIALDDIYPIETKENVIDALAEFGIEEHECGEVVETLPEVEIEITEVTTTTVEAAFTPNEACASYFILLGIEAEMQQWVAMMGVSLEQLVEQWSIARSGASTHEWTEQIPNTEYTIYVLPKDAEGNNGELNTLKVKTEQMGGAGVSVIDLDVKVLTKTSVFVTATPNAETSEYHYILIEKAYAEEVGQDSTMAILHADPYALYEIDEWEWVDLTPETDFYAIAQGKNASGEWGEITIVEFTTTVEGCEEIVVNYSVVYPNPASDYVKINSEIEGEVNIYDMTGRCVRSVSVSDVSSATINIEDLNEGVYFINFNGKVEKLVIE